LTLRRDVRPQVADGARPLAMSGWEDLIEEAGGDLERLEGHVAAAAERLVALQVGEAAGLGAWLAEEG
jgi:hypothetical protein